MKSYDIIVIGGGPGGLSAAIYAARFMRSVLVIDKGDGRSKGKQINENYLGFPKGIAARRLGILGKQQAEKFGVTFTRDIILSSSCKKTAKSQSFTLKGKEAVYRSKALIVATGVKDIFPTFPHSENFLGKSIFWCIMCDGWKIRDKKVLIVGFDDMAAKTCLRLLNFTKDISILINCKEEDISIKPSDMKELKKRKIDIHYGNIAKAKGKKGMLESVTTDTGEEIKTEYIFSKLGYKVQSDIAQELGAVIESKGFIKTDENQRTSVPFLYAAGDVTNDTSHQILTAAHQGAVAAASADEDLLEKYQK